MLKKLFLTLFASSAFVVCGRAPAHAADVLALAASPAWPTRRLVKMLLSRHQRRQSRSQDFLTPLVQILVIVIGAMAIIMLVVSGFRFSFLTAMPTQLKVLVAALSTP